MVALTGRREAYYTRHARRAAGVRLGREVRLPVSGAALPLAARARAARRRWDLPPPAFVDVPPEPRSGRQLRARRARPRADEPGTLARDDGAAAARCRARRCCFRARSSAASAPFLYLRRLTSASSRAAVRSGRARVPDAVSEHRRLSSARRARRSRRSRATFERCKLDLGERDAHAPALRAARRSAAAAARRRRVPRAASRAASTAPCCRASAFALRFFTPDHADDRVLIVNLGRRSRRGRRSPSRCSRRRPAPTGRSAGRARIRATAAAARRMSGRTAAG